MRRRLLAWYRRNRRDLPWRRTADPYRVWISEIMLQQTRVAAVIPYYDRFLTLFPNPAALAAASEEQGSRAHLQKRIHDRHVELRSSRFP